MKITLQPVLLTIQFYGELSVGCPLITGLLVCHLAPYVHMLKGPWAKILKPKLHLKWQLSWSL